jgi:hypothetical protein
MKFAPVADLLGWRLAFLFALPPLLASGQASQQLSRWLWA